MTPVLWALVAVVGAVLFGFGLRSFILRGFAPAEPGAEPEDGAVDVPLAPLQKRAWWGLGIVVATSAALVAVVVAMGPTTYSEDRTQRLLTFAIFAAGAISYLVMLALTGARRSGSDVVVDERDRAIMTRALSVALVAGLVTLAAWTIGLTEVYWGEKAIPIDFPYFILWSTFLVALAGREIGILLGYAGWYSHGES